jgi:D-inositol-3-phosphate glycosyltransferase
MSPWVSPHRAEPLRIAMLSLHSSPIGPLGTQNTGGMSVYVREVAKWLANFGHLVDIFTCAPTNHEMIELYPGVRLVSVNPQRGVPIPKETMFDILGQVCGSLVRFAQRGNIRYQTVHSHYWLSGVVGSMVQSRWNCPHVTMFHTLGRMKNRTTAGACEPHRRIRHEGKIAASASAVVAPVEAEKQHLLRHYGADPEKVHVVPCGVNLDRFIPMDKTQARRALNLDPASEVILFVGRFAPVKGLKHLLKAMADIRRPYPRARLMVVGGDGPEAGTTAALARRAQQLGIDANVQLAGRIDHDVLPLYYNAADLVVLPSSYESFGLVTLEAMACGTPVAATATGGAAGIIREGINGVLIPQPDHMSIRRSMGQLLTLLSRKAFSVEEIRASVTGFSWDCIADMNLKLYHALLFQE